MAEASATLDLADRTREADAPHSPVVRFAADRPLRLDAGVDFCPLQIAYQTYGVLNAFDPQENVSGGCRYMRDLLRRYHKNVSLALAAYNAGPGVVDAIHGVPAFPETRAYVARVSAALHASTTL